MDFLTRKEIDGLKGDIEASNNTLDADKYIFEQQLKNGLGDAIINELRNPSKPNKKLARRLKFKRFWLIIKELFNH